MVEQQRKAKLEEEKDKAKTEAYSDPEELFNQSKKKKKKKKPDTKFERFAGSDSDPDSGALNRETSDAEEQMKGDGDMKNGELEKVKEGKEKNQKPGKKYAAKSMICLECKKTYADRKGLTKHMMVKHKKEDWVFSSANELSAVPMKTDSPADSGIVKKKKKVNVVVQKKKKYAQFASSDSDADSEEEVRRDKKHQKKKKQKTKSDESAESESDPNAGAPNREASDAEEEMKSDGDMKNEKVENVKKARGKNQKPGSAGKKYNKKSMICLECRKCYADRKGLQKHMIEKHKKEDWVFTSANELSAVPVKTDSSSDSGAE